MAPTRIVLLPAGTVVPPASNQRKMLIPSSSRVAIPSTSYTQPAQVKMERATTPRRIDPLELLNPTPITKTRKRERLTALTPEEKLARRKMKNRIAAQTARDRKKERTGGLEDCVKDLVDENRRLREENASLMERLTRLEQEAAARRETPSMPVPTPIYTLPYSLPTTTPVATTLGSAASINDLQQRAQAVTTVSSRRSTVAIPMRVLMTVLLCSLHSSKLTPISSKISETSTSIKCARLSMRTSPSKERKERLRMTIHRLLSKRPHPIPRHPP